MKPDSQLDDNLRKLILAAAPVQGRPEFKKALFDKLVHVVSTRERTASHRPAVWQAAWRHPALYAGLSAAAVLLIAFLFLHVERLAPDASPFFASLPETSRVGQGKPYGLPQGGSSVADAAMEDKMALASQGSAKMPRGLLRGASQAASIRHSSSPAGALVEDDALNGMLKEIKIPTQPGLSVKPLGWEIKPPRPCGWEIKPPRPCGWDVKPLADNGRNPFAGDQS